MQDLENEHIPVEIPRDLTYSTADAYINDILAFHDSRLRHQPNAIGTLTDALYQMAALTTMRAVFPHFFQAELRRGPFVFSLTDIHQSNLYVDEQWTITKVLDLEWVCSRPVEMLHPPYWLTNQSVDRIDAHEYEQMHREFMDALEDEERRLAHKGQKECSCRTYSDEDGKRDRFGILSHSTVLLDSSRSSMITSSRYLPKTTSTILISSESWDAIGVGMQPASFEQRLRTKKSMT
jgi:hypothetical protein